MDMFLTPKNNWKFQRGQSLFEVVVVLLLISISISGMMVTLLKSQQLSLLAIQKSDALMLAQSMAVKLQLNRQELMREFSNYFKILSEHDKLVIQCSELDNCTNQRQALTDLVNWQRELQLKLPQYRFSICRDSLSNSYPDTLELTCDNKLTSPVVIKLQWQTTFLDDSKTEFYSMTPVIY